ncbi:copper resistance protein NlpE [Algoriphagus mannitolivorans]|uniref:copper resistance protein NlpE n=1 Tax=Algoriphagus mannitolivorans TaxID=226504 RepID=UPI0003F9D4C0|nr:copper resistance protein NlpE [Algoriphagus mannitolivorans]
MKSFAPIASLLLWGIAWGCSPKPPAQEAKEEPSEIIQEKQSSETTESVSGATYTGDNSQTSVDWPGTYFAVIPCKSCEGIELWVTLKAEGTFEMKTNYLGLNDAREEIFTGNLVWDVSGSTVSFEGLIGNYPGKFKIGENQIWYLDKNGNLMQGELADRYILKKK